METIKNLLPTPFLHDGESIRLFGLVLLFFMAVIGIAYYIKRRRRKRLEKSDNKA